MTSLPGRLSRRVSLQVGSLSHGATVRRGRRLSVGPGSLSVYRTRSLVAAARDGAASLPPVKVSRRLGLSELDSKPGPDPGRSASEAALDRDLLRAEARATISTSLGLDRLAGKSC